MTDEIPQWALERAAELANKEGGEVGAASDAYTPDELACTYIGRTFARYIAQHEEAPPNELADALNGLVPDVPDPLEGESHAEAFSRELTKELEARGLKIVRAEQ